MSYREGKLIKPHQKNYINCFTFTWDVLWNLIISIGNKPWCYLRNKKRPWHPVTQRSAKCDVDWPVPSPPDDSSTMQSWSISLQHILLVTWRNTHLRKRRVEIQKRVLRGHYPFHANFPRLIGIAQFLPAEDPTAVWVHNVSLFFSLLFCCFAVEALQDATFLPLPSLLPRTCCIRYYRLPIKHLSSWLPSFLASLLPSFLPSFLSFWNHVSWCNFFLNVFSFWRKLFFFLAPLPLDIGSSKKSICSAMVYLVFCYHSHGSCCDGSLSLRGLVICRSLPGIETWSSFFGKSACIISETISSSFWASVLLATRVFEFGTCLRPMVGSFWRKIYQVVLIALQYDLTISTDLLVSYASNLVLPVNRMPTQWK